MGLRKKIAVSGKYKGTECEDGAVYYESVWWTRRRDGCIHALSLPALLNAVWGAESGSDGYRNGGARPSGDRCGDRSPAHEKLNSGGAGSAGIRPVLYRPYHRDLASGSRRRAV